jgi:uncharacterized sulfatase
VALLLLAFAACAAPQARPPNLILIIGDDHGYPYAGFMGDPIVRTPHLDGLAEGGTVFTTGYVTASACRPSLQSLLTGLQPLQVQALLRRYDGFSDPRWRDEGLPGMLTRRGYASFQAGKLWDWSYREVGFSAGTKREPPRGHWLTKWMGGVESLKIGRRTMEPVYAFIDAHLDQPFFLWLAPKLPHLPTLSRGGYRTQYRDLGLSDSAVAYYANITALDDVIGELVEHLDLRGLRERTMIVYLSDNGWQQGLFEDLSKLKAQRGPKGKASMHELGFRTPILFHWPGHVPAGVVRDDLVSALDLFPTFLAYAGLDAPPDRMGLDLRPFLESGEPVPRAYLMGGRWSEVPGVAADPRGLAYFVRSSRWHYIWYPHAHEDELYDMERDPAEDHDVSEGRAEVVAELRARVTEWLEALHSATPWDAAAGS